jgi:hypothetical protein
MNQTRHDVLLTALYRGDSEMVRPKNPLRFQLERERRLLDLCRLLWGLWPSAAIYGRAHFGDAMSLETAARLPEAHAAADIEAALAQSFDLWISSVESPVLAALRCYDDARAGRARGTRQPSSGERALLAGIIPNDFQLFDSRIDVIPFSRTLEYYGKLHAPDTVIRGLFPDERAVTLAFYRREGKVVAADVARVLRGLS